MNTQDIFTKASTFTLARVVNGISLETRELVALFLGVISFISFCIVLLVGVLPFSPRVAQSLLVSPEAKTLILFFFAYIKFFSLILLCSVTSFMVVTGLNSLYLYHYLRGVKRIFEKSEDDITYEVAAIFSEKTPTFATLVNEKESLFLINRLQLNKEYLIEHFGNLAFPPEIQINRSSGFVTLGSLWVDMYEEYEDISSYMFSSSVKKESFYQAVAWMDRTIENRKRKSAWWWRENLSTTKGFARTLSYGMTGYMARYSSEMSFDPKLSLLGDTVLHQNECTELETILSRRHGLSNVVIVGKSGSGRYTVTLQLSRAISEGNVSPEIEYKRMFLLHSSNFELINDKIELENTVITLFNQAAVARNIIFVIEDFAPLVAVFSRFELDFWSLIDPYIEYGAVPLVVLVDEALYSKDEHKRIFDKRFEMVRMRDLNADLLLPYLEDKAVARERETGVFFTYHSLEILAQTLPTFFAEESPLVKSDSILGAIASSATTSLITGDVMQAYLRSVTGVPLGKIENEEKEKLLHLEDVLKKNVVGQQEAITAVAKTMRRIRSGLSDGKKPMGTFLFFGPTGSGKTETAKTLAKVFFGGEEYMSRIDMGEYTLPESVTRLLGDKDSEGELAHLIHSRPHGVLLLDEFEKSSQEIKDMFLRILDEGVFTDGQNNVISLRTQIIVATSNAGTELIIKSLHEAGGSPGSFQDLKRKVIDFVLEKGILKPELLNRFDESVMFLPLSSDAMTGVTEKKLKALSGRIEERGYKVTFDEDLIKYVVAHSEASEFGGRAIERVIQDTVEDIVSKKIIQGDVEEGGTIVLSVKDLPTL